MIILDTHAWIWHTLDSGQLSKTAVKAIDKAEKLGVSIISVWEFSMLVAKGRIQIDIDILEWIECALNLPKISLIQMTPEIAALSTMLPGEFHADPADRIIAASCLKYDFPLITKDKNIASWGKIKTIW